MTLKQESNFSFLTEHWAFLLDDARQVEGYALRDPRAAAIFARRSNRGQVIRDHDYKGHD